MKGLEGDSNSLLSPLPKSKQHNHHNHYDTDPSFQSPSNSRRKRINTLTDYTTPETTKGQCRDNANFTTTDEHRCRKISKVSHSIANSFIACADNSNTNSSSVAYTDTKYFEIVNIDGSRVGYNSIQSSWTIKQMINHIISRTSHAAADHHTMDGNVDHEYYLDTPGCSGISGVIVSSNHTFVHMLDNGITYRLKRTCK